MLATFVRRVAPLAALVTSLGISPVAAAYPGSGGFHGGAGFHGGTSFHGGTNFHGGAHYGYAQGGGWHGWGWRGGYYGWGFCCAGLWLWSLPWYYTTYWWGGVPYYYADSYYYVWNATSGRYEAVRPPAGLANAPATPVSIELFMYPKAGQTAEQQAKDRYECHRWAADQTGFDPTRAGGGADADSAAKRADYVRAQGACLEGRDYSVK